MKNNEKSRLPENGEISDTGKYSPPFEEMVATEILFSESGKIAIKKIILPESIEDDVKVAFITQNEAKISTSLLFNKSETRVVTKIHSQGIEENMVMEILITESGEIIIREITYPKKEDKVSIVTLFPRSEVIVKTNIQFSYPWTFDTKKIYFPASKEQL